MYNILMTPNNDDCLKILPTLEEKSIDFVLGIEMEQQKMI